LSLTSPLHFGQARMSSSSCLIMVVPFV
jgi:hypothetical protein